ncbi:protein SPMIP2 isoform X2 [Pelobates fuscus]|uniref:protein SPMIP2 isoform X2 n=1 Tax=Pelobates fuscus TaxID=191477 RepID=UPI002FE437EF
MIQKQHGRPSTSLASSKPAGTGQRILYTGPDNIGDYRPKFPDFTRYIGEFMPSEEGTSEVNYLCRAAPGTPHPRPKDMHVGGIGWGVTAFSHLNRSQLLSNNQIKLWEFRNACEERITHSYQNPWCPPPHILDAEGFGARATLAWTHDKYEDYCYGNRNWTSAPEKIQQDATGGQLK